jgi:N-acetylglucosamine-6-phosphate deacetylase
VKAIINGIILHQETELQGQALLFDEKVLGIVPKDQVPEAAEIIDAKGLYVSPGLIDLHIHGYLNEDTSDGSEEGIRAIAKGLLKNGVTSFLPTTMTVRWEEIETAFDVVRGLKVQSARADFDGAQVLGAHAEGPFINPKRKGAQAEEAILAPDADRVIKHKDIIRLITMAPEMPGGLDMIHAITGQTEIVVSIGHTDADFETAMAAIKAGASYITHLFNAMTALNHRNPGVVGAALQAPVVTELIADTFHVHKGLFQFIHDVIKDKLVLVTDCTRAGGLGDGEYTLGGQPIFVNGIQCRLKDGTIAGSVLKLNEAVRNLRDNTNLNAAQAVQTATQNPAQAISQSDKGSLDKGKDADIVLFDQDMNAKVVYIKGHLKYKSGE